VPNHQSGKAYIDLHKLARFIIGTKTRYSPLTVKCDLAEEENELKGTKRIKNIYILTLIQRPAYAVA
jgi:hypothetical protein